MSESICEACGQKMTWRRRKLNASMARTLLRLYWWDMRHPNEFVHAPSLKGDNHEVSQLSWWGLVDKKDGEREDGNPNQGYWRITARGRAFACDRLALPSHAWTFDTRYRQPELDDTVLVRISEIKGKGFDYTELMRNL